MTTWTFTVDAAAAWHGADEPSLIAPESPFGQAMRRYVRSAGVPDRVLLELYTYELVERCRTIEASPDCRRSWSIPWCPRTACQAADIEAHAVAELWAMLPKTLTVRVVDQPPESIARSLDELLGVRAFDPHAYCEQLPATQGRPPDREVVGALLVRDRAVLLEFRPATAKVYPNVWDSPGGHIEPGETSEETLIRELDEELGIVPTRFQRIAVLDDVEPSTGTRYRHHVYVVTEFTGEPAHREGQQIQWLPLAQLRDRADVMPLTLRLATRL